MAKSYSKRHLTTLKVSTIRAIAVKKRVKNVAKKTKTQLINAIHPVPLTCRLAGHRTKKGATKKIRRTGARTLARC